MEQRSLRVVDSNKTFFGKISSTLSKIMIPTKIGINGMVINFKRNNLLKSYEAKHKEGLDEEKKKIAEDKYQEAYTLYLEAIDKYIMDSVYKKVKLNTASDFEKEAMGNYYKITSLKENEYIEYKYRKQKYLIELDYESLKLNAKEKLLEKYKAFYIEQMDIFYKGILKNYAVKLADTPRGGENLKIKVYTSIFETLNEYVSTILPIKDNGKIDERIRDDYNKLDQFDIGELDAKDYVEKNMLLLNISRQLFTHSLPLVAAEQCYNKLLSDLRLIIVRIESERQKSEAYDLLLDLAEAYNIKTLSTKVYWEKLEEREKYKKFWEKYKNTDNPKEKEILFLKREIETIEDNENNRAILAFYKEKLISYGVMRKIKNSCRTSTKYKKIK